uniref:Putative secreted protein n=1 Tax=Anopheles marajoara TaxID=58244 RepID=A0A2M4CGB7_9DIPT
MFAQHTSCYPLLLAQLIFSHLLGVCVVARKVSEPIMADIVKVWNRRSASSLKSVFMGRREGRSMGQE